MHSSFVLYREKVQRFHSLLNWKMICKSVIQTTWTDRWTTSVLVTSEQFTGQSEIILDPLVSMPTGLPVEIKQLPS